MKETIKSSLLRNPRIYAKVLSICGHRNAERIVYLNLIEKGDTGFDVGANTGHFTLMFSHIVGERGQVHAFEPVLPPFEMLSQNVKNRQKIGNIYLNNVAVSDENGITILYMLNNDNGQSSMTSHDIGAWANPASVDPFPCQMIKLDDYNTQLGITRLSFMKIDVEGAELLALRGFSNSLKWLKPIVFLEVCHGWTKDFGYQPADIIDLLTQTSYTHFYLVTDEVRLLANPTSGVSLGKLSDSANLLCMTSDIHAASISNLQRIESLRA